MLCLNQPLSIFESEIAEKDAIPHIPQAMEDVSTSEKIRDRSQRIIRRKANFTDENLRLVNKMPGLLDTLSFEKAADLPVELDLHEVQVRVRGAIGVNFKDYLVALSRIADNVIGTDCADLVEMVGADCSIQPGDRVAVLALDTYRSVVRCHEDLVVKILTHRLK